MNAIEIISEEKGKFVVEKESEDICRCEFDAIWFSGKARVFLEDRELELLRLQVKHGFSPGRWGKIDFLSETGSLEIRTASINSLHQVIDIRLGNPIGFEGSIRWELELSRK